MRFENGVREMRRQIAPGMSALVTACCCLKQPLRSVDEDMPQSRAHRERPGMTSKAEERGPGAPSSAPYRLRERILLRHWGRSGNAVEEPKSHDNQQHDQR